MTVTLDKRVDDFITTDRQLFIDNIGKEVWVRGCLARNATSNHAAAGTLKFSDGVLRQVGQLQD